MTNTNYKVVCLDGWWKCLGPKERKGENREKEHVPYTIMIRMNRIDAVCIGVYKCINSVTETHNVYMEYCFIRTAEKKAECKKNPKHIGLLER